MDEHERDLTEATAELSETLESLRAELMNGPGGARSPRLPRPPTPSELLRFTERYTIPATIGLLEAAIRSLELLAAVLRAVDGRPIDAVSGEAGSRSSLGGRDRLAERSRETLRRLDDALAEFQSTARGEPSNPELQRLLADARELRSEVDARLAEATDAGGDSISVEEERDTSAHTREESDPDRVDIDVDEELASIKRSIDEDSGSGSRSGSDSENDGPSDEP